MEDDFSEHFKWILCAMFKRGATENRWDEMN